MSIAEGSSVGTSPSVRHDVKGDRIASVIIPEGDYDISSNIGGWVAETNIPNGYSVTDYTGFDQVFVPNGAIIHPRIRSLSTQTGVVLSVFEYNVEVYSSLIPFRNTPILTILGEQSSISLGLLVLDAFHDDDYFVMYANRDFSVEADEDILVQLYLALN